MSAKISGKSVPTKSDIKPNWLSSLGILLALAWLLITFMQEEPNLFLVLGGINLIVMIYSRFISRKNQGLELEGGITGYLLTWLLAFIFYQQKEFVISFTIVLIINLSCSVRFLSRDLAFIINVAHAVVIIPNVSIKTML